VRARTVLVPASDLAAYRRAEKRAGRVVVLSTLGGSGYYVTTAPAR